MVWREGSGFRTIRFFGISLRIDERLDGVNEDERTEAQDADYSYVPSLSDELALLILARVPRSVYGTLCSVNKRYLDLLRTGELYKVRREIGIKEPLVFMLASGEPSWRALDPCLGSSRFLPVLPSDACFMFGDKESLCTGTHLLVCGREFEGLVTWRYELTADQWFKGPPMITPRCLFGSASCGDVACVAGGFKVLPVKEILNSAEMYDPETKSWFSLPKMNKARKLCSGCFMDNKFYVIGGEGEGGNLSCGEFYDLERKRWVLIPDMMKGALSSSSDSPPLVAVVNNELYALDASSNQVMIYLKNTNSWKELGKVPVRADRSRGWGVAFKSLGDELLVIGGTWDGSVGRGMMTICTCRPDPSSNDFKWRVLKTNGNHLSPFVFNCSVMVA